VFSENAFLKLARHFAERLEQDAIYRFLARCRNDYGYLVRNAERIEQLQLPPDTRCICMRHSILPDTAASC